MHNRIHYFPVKSSRLPGSTYEEIRKTTLTIFKQLESRTKRRPYVKSSYFSNKKVFFDYFWKHIWEKGRKTRTERLKYFSAGLELMKRCREKPTIRETGNSVLYRFYGITADKHTFVVQIKLDKKQDRLFLMSIFSWE